MPIESAILVKALDTYLKCLEGHGFKRTEDVLIVAIGEKKLCHWRGNELVATYDCSRSKRPLSCVEDSLGTPWGLHEIAAKHGEGQPAGMVFKGRVATGARWQELAEPGNQGSLVTTRILRLRGLEPGLNAGPGIDSHERYIYIHGTNRPEAFPENISAGCLLMLDEPLIELFSKVPEGTHVFIEKP
jgi:hypothetical protein